MPTIFHLDLIEFSNVVSQTLRGGAQQVIRNQVRGATSCVCASCAQRSILFLKKKKTYPTNGSNFQLQSASTRTENVFHS